MYRIGLYEKALPECMDILSKLLYAKKAGYDYLEISIDETEEKLSRLNMSEKHCLKLQRDMCNAGVRIDTMCFSAQRKYPLGTPNSALIKKSMDYFEKALNFSRLLGIRIIQLAGYDVYYEESTEKTRELFCENLHLCVQKAAKYGVLLGFETMETPFMNTVEKAMVYVKKEDSPFLGVYPDIGNVTNGTKDAKKDLLSGKGRIFAAHIKETTPGVFRNLQFGGGQVDFPALIPFLKELGVAMFTLEFWHDGKSDALSYIEKARGYFRERGLL